MNRRDFLRSTTLLSAALALEDRLRAVSPAAGDHWRTFEISTRAQVLQPSGATRVWLPLPLTIETAYQRPVAGGAGAEGADRIQVEGGTARVVGDADRGMAMVAAAWPAGVEPVLTVVSRVQTRDVSVDLTAPAASRVRPASVARFLEASALIPSDGIVKQTAIAITRDAKTDLEKARAIYEWIVDNTFRDPNTKGCGLGDIRFMLESKNLGGKCADLNALFVGLAHAAGLPARDAYGLRVAKSELGYKSLGIATENATKAQHCRAEVYLDGYGWVPVDPADVRKVVLEEPPGHRALDDDLVRRARARLFGSWEMNWIAYNFEHDVALPGSARRKLPFLMYPQGETANGPLDSLDPDAFSYHITAVETTA